MSDKTESRFEIYRDRGFVTKEKAESTALHRRARPGGRVYRNPLDRRSRTDVSKGSYAAYVVLAPQLPFACHYPARERSPLRSDELDHPFFACRTDICGHSFFSGLVVQVLCFSGC